jgi:hypothetical protein
MKFQVGKFTCELSLDHRGRVQVEWWLRVQPTYLNRAERTEYQAGRSAFLESLEASRESRRNAARAPPDGCPI